MAEVGLGVTGSIAAFKAAALASSLSKAGVRVTTILTRHAQEFIGAPSFWGITQAPVITDDYSAQNPGELERVALADRLDLLVVAPATANFIGALAHGLASDYLTTLAITVRCPIWVAPAMNDAMWANVAVQENVATLQRRGVRILDPEEGLLACGHVGPGRMVEPEAIAAEVLAFLPGASD
jgi:phosphopantothenoylcysteine decarboxylase/phosphopantothenate--cysteine ligase